MYQTVWRGARGDYPQRTYRWKWLAQLAIALPNLVLGRGLHGDRAYHVRQVAP